MWNYADTIKGHDVKQQKREVLAAYAKAPAGASLTEFLATCGVKPTKFHGWRARDPSFEIEFQTIQRIRASVDADELVRYRPAIYRAVCQAAAGGDIAAATLWSKWVGLIREQPGVTINNTVGAQATATAGAGVTADSSDHELATLGKEFQRVAALVARSRARSEPALPDLARDSGPRADAGEAAPGS